jgi:hypothetical protein
MPDFTIKRNDYGATQPLRAILKRLKVNAETGEAELDGEGKKQYVAIDLTGATVHLLALSKSDDPDNPGKKLLLEAAMTGWAGGALGADGKVEWSPAKGAGEVKRDTHFADEYELEFEITGPAAAWKVTVPQEGKYSLKIEADTNNA